MNPCKNCGCHEHEGIAQRLTRRARKIISSKEFRRLTNIESVPRDVKYRTSDDPVWGMGLSDFLPAYDSDKLVARFYGAVHRTAERLPQGIRYYAMQLLMPSLLLECRPHEYNKGDAHPIDPGAPIGKYDFDFLDRLSDEQWARWLASQWSVFVDFVVQQEVVNNGSL